jgi:hypothetical protein
VVVLRAFARAVQKLRKGLLYDKPIYSVVEYFYRLVVEEICPSFLQEKTREKEALLTPARELADLLCHSWDRILGK